MKKSVILIFVASFLFACSKNSPSEPSEPSGPYVSSFAGAAPPGYEDGPGITARFNHPLGITVDISGNFFIADQRSHTIRKITPSGIVSTVAGSGMQNGYIDAQGTSAKFSYPTGITLDKQGNIYVCEYLQGVIRKITPGGLVSTFAGKGPYGPNFFSTPFGMVTDSHGNLIVADQNKIFKIDPAGNITGYAGSYGGGFLNGDTLSSRFRTIANLAIDGQDNVYVADTENHSIRKIFSDGHVITLAGTGSPGYLDGDVNTAQFNYPNGVAVDNNGNVYVADLMNDRIRKISANGIVSTIAGNGKKGLADGPALDAQFFGPVSLTMGKDGKLYVVDLEYSRIRSIKL